MSKVRCVNLLSVLLIGSIFQHVFAQNTCDFNSDTSEIGVYCDNAPKICGALLDGYNGKLASKNDNTNQPDPLCSLGGTAENMQWFSFIPCEDYVSIMITPSNCENPISSAEGVQAGIYTNCDFTESLDCASDFTGAPLTIQSTVTPGQTYYMYIDGYEGSVCDFVINVLEGINTASINIGASGEYSIKGKDDVCADGFSSNKYNVRGDCDISVSTSCSNIQNYIDEIKREWFCYEWTITPSTGWKINGDYHNAMELDIIWEQPGNYSISCEIKLHPWLIDNGSTCIVGTSCSIQTAFIEVNPLDAIYDTIGICLGETLEYEGNSITEVGDYRFEDGSKACFDAYYVHVIPIEEYFQVENESIIIDILNGPHAINILDNDQLPSNYTVELEEASNPSFKKLGFEDGLLEFDITKQFVDPIRVPYEVCEVNTQCNYCETGELGIIHEEYKDVIYPNVMTPNGDGINDYLRFNDAPELPHVRLLIYNRWGDKIHESFPYKNDWDGDNYPDGVYFYILQVGDDYIKRSFMLLR